MTTRRLLILIPLAISLVLVQSYFWVPTYEQQAKGNPGRLEEYINASSGDASILNPILSADSASSEIEAKVFEGLLDRDEDLRLRGRLAKSWRIYEIAYFYLNERAGAGDAGTTVERLRRLKEQTSQLPAGVVRTLDNIDNISVVPARHFFVDKPIRGDDGAMVGPVRIEVSAPPRIKLEMKAVDQDLFTHLEKILGATYFDGFDALQHIKPGAAVGNGALLSLAREILPATAHHPVIEFHLRPDVKFHDGHVLDAEDVRFTYEAIVNPDNLSPRVADYEPVKDVEVVDPLTVRITYKRLYSPALVSWAMGILPEHLLNAGALEKEALKAGKDPAAFTLRQSGFNRSPVGCGPFVFREWKSDQHIILDRFDDYWEGPPNYKRYVFRVIPDPLTQEMEFYAGTIDAYAVQPHQVERLKNNPRFQSFSGASFGYTYIGYNMRREPFDDVRVRKALGMAIDTQEIIKYVLYDQGEPITGPFVKQTDYYNHAIAPLPYDPEAALALLAEAGWHRNGQGWLEKDGKRLQFTLITNNGNELRKAILAIAQDAWKQIGIDVSTDLLEWSVFIQERVNKQDFDALVLGWSMGIDPDLFQIWHSSQTHPHQLNFVGFRNPEADDLIIKIRQEYNHDRQVKDCHRLHEIIFREQPYTFLYVGKWTAVLDKRIVIKTVDEKGTPSYEKIKPTKTGSYTYYFNKWIKLAQAPDLTP